MCPNQPSAAVSTYRLLLVDDQPVFLELARAILWGHRGFEIVGEAGSGEQALALLPDANPDVVLLDVEMPGMHGFEAARRLMAAAPGLRVVMVSASPDTEYAMLATAAGALGFLSKKLLSADALAALLA